MGKKILLSLFLLISYYYCSAQWLPLQPINEVSFYANPGYKRTVIKDSLIYTIRVGGLEELNVNSHATKYHWANYSVMYGIVADTGNTYVYLSGNYKYIGRYNHSSNKYENICTGNLQNEQVNDIGVAPGGKVWAITTNTSRNVAIFNGINWTLYPIPTYYYCASIKVINDTSAYLIGGSKIYKFHNGVFDTVYTFPSSGAYFADCDVGANGDLWIAAMYKLIHLHNGNATIYDTTNVPIGSDQFLHVKIGTNGKVWTTGNKNKMLEYDGISWHVNSFPYPYNYSTIEDFSLDKYSNPWVIAEYNGTHPLYLYNGNTWSHIPFPFMPVKPAKAMGVETPNNYNSSLLFATNEGLFTVNGSFYFNGFSDSTAIPHANDINCFTDNEPSYQPSFGSHQGVCSLSGFNNSQLPSKNVNHICNYNGTYYIGTDSGLVTYNGIFYNNINTSNSPLPSDKITFVTVGSGNYCNNNNALYVGTDKGLAVYQNTQWTVYDTSNVPVNNFYVTGVLSMCLDSAIYISTLGNGLIKVFPHGSYNLFNTSNGKLLDDSLYYVKFIELGECGELALFGTGHHGLAYSGFYNTPTHFNYDTVDGNGGGPIHSSTMVEFFNNMYVVATDAGYYSMTPCGGVPVNKEVRSQLNWYQQNDQLIISAPAEFYGKGNVLLTDMLGQTVIEKDCDTRNGKINLDVNNLTSGIYIVRLNIGDKTGLSKVVLSR